MCIILKKEDFTRSWTDGEEKLVYKILEKRGDKLYSPERNIVWAEKMGEVKTVDSLPITERNGYIYTGDGIYSSKSTRGIVLLLAKGKTKVDRGRYRIFKAKIPRYTQYIEDKYHIVSKSLKLTEDITEEIMSEVKEVIKESEICV